MGTTTDADAPSHANSSGIEKKIEDRDTRNAERSYAFIVATRMLKTQTASGLFAHASRIADGSRRQKILATTRAVGSPMKGKVRMSDPINAHD
jgi:hypothetical protein